MASLACPDPYALLDPAETVETPFRYFLTERCLLPEFEEALLAWFERDAPWTLVETDFYEQFEFDLRDADLPAPLGALVEPGMLDRLRRTMEAALDTRLGPQVHVR